MLAGQQRREDVANQLIAPVYSGTTLTHAESGATLTV